MFSSESFSFPFELMLPMASGICPSRWLFLRLMAAMFCISPISAGKEPEMELNERSSHVRLCRSPIPVQFVMEPVKLFERRFNAVTRPNAQSGPSIQLSHGSIHPTPRHRVCGSHGSEVGSSTCQPSLLSQWGPPSRL